MYLAYEAFEKAILRERDIVNKKHLRDLCGFYCMVND